MVFLAHLVGSPFGRVARLADGGLSGSVGGSAGDAINNCWRRKRGYWCVREGLWENVSCDGFEERITVLIRRVQIRRCRRSQVSFGDMSTGAGDHCDGTFLCGLWVGGRAGC